MPSAKPVSDGDNTTSRAEQVSAIAAAVTAVGAFVVVPASIAMYIRLRRAHLPADLGVVASLPHEFLLALGLGYVIGPLLLLTAFAVTVVWLPGDEGKLNSALRWKSDDRGWKLLPLIAFAVIVGLGLPFAVFGVRSFPPGIAFAYSLGAVAVFLGISSLLYGHHPNRGTSFVLVAVLAALVFVGWAIAFAAVRTSFQPTTLCLTGGDALKGVLIGRTGDQFFVGEPDDRGTLVGVPAGFARSKIIHGLEADNFGVGVVGNPRQVTFQRTSFIVTDLEEDVHHLRRPSNAGIPILGYYPGQGVSSSQRKSARRRYQRLVVTSQAALTNPRALAEAVTRTLDKRDPQISKPPRRIASIPSSKVEGYRLGATGPCPIRSRF